MNFEIKLIVCVIAVIIAKCFGHGKLPREWTTLVEEFGDEAMVLIGKAELSESDLAQVARWKKYGRKLADGTRSYRWSIEEEVLSSLDKIDLNASQWEALDRLSWRGAGGTLSYFNRYAKARARGKVKPGQTKPWQFWDHGGMVSTGKDKKTNPKNDELENPKNDQRENPKNDELENAKNDQPENPKKDKPENPKDDQPENPKVDELENPKNDQPENPKNDELENPKNDELENPKIDELDNPTGFARVAKLVVTVMVALTVAIGMVFCFCGVLSLSPDAKIVPSPPKRAKKLGK